MGFKLLLADDSITIQKVVGIIFANEECELTVVGNGDAALEKAKEILPDIMLVDALMPGRSGYEVCEAVRREPELRYLPLLLLTGAFEPFDVDKARLSGADDFISKPFESQMLIDKVKSMLELGRERQASAPAPEPAAAVPVSPLPVEETVSAADVFGLDESVTASGGGASWELAEAESAPEAAAPVSPVEETVWTIDTAAEVVEPPAEALPSADSGKDIQVAEEVVEVSPDDDLWGAFELEPIEENEENLVDVAETYTVEPVSTAADVSSVDSTWESAEEDVFAAPAEEGPGGVATASPFEEAAGFDFVGEEPSSDEGAGEVASAEAESAAPSDEFTADRFAEFAFSADELPAAESGSEEMATITASEPTVSAEGAGGGVVSVGGAYFFGEPESAPAPAHAVSGEAVAGAGPAVALSEEQLEAVISRISREVIERIVWEVVPDLAEALIKEEIRKIKEGS